MVFRILFRKISLSSAGMQSLLDICNSYAIEHVLTYNSNKSDTDTDTENSLFRHN